ncbi:MAG: helix-turn-helix transcriptional regulator [Acidimicrobiia bacterium]|jgi:PadR family transcriptional regulator, regulatory protein PadR
MFRSTTSPPDLPRHYLQACLLLLIDGRPTYGYTLRDQLRDFGVEQKDWSQLYRTLRGMEKSGLVLSCWTSSEFGPARRTYHVTDKGAERLRTWAEGMAEAQPLVATFLSRYGVAPAAGTTARSS